MTGLIPWLRELIFGRPSCNYLRDCFGHFCMNPPDDRCSSGYCWHHHYRDCCVKNYFTGEIVMSCKGPEEDKELAELRKMIR